METEKSKCALRITINASTVTHCSKPKCLETVRNKVIFEISKIYIVLILKEACAHDASYLLADICSITPTPSA